MPGPSGADHPVPQHPVQPVVDRFGRDHPAGSAATRTAALSGHPGRPAGGAAEGDVNGVAARDGRRVSRAGPVVRIIGLANFIGDLGATEQRIDGRRSGRVGGAGVVHDALQFLGVRQAPVVVAEIFLGVLGLDPGQRGLPVHALAAVGLRPHQARGAVGDGAVAVVVEIVLAVARVAADALHEERLLHAAARHEQVVAFDPAVGEVDAEKFVVTLERLADVLGARSVLRVDDALAFARVAVGELEILRVDERRQAASLRTGAAGVDAAENDQRIEFLDRRQPPVAEPAELGGVEFGRQLLGLGQGQLVAAG